MFKIYNHCLIFTLGLLCFKTHGQVSLTMVIAQIDSIRFDRPTFEQQVKADSLKTVNGTEIIDTLPNGSIISSHPVMPIRMSNPYILFIKIKTSFLEPINSSQISVRVWEHEHPKLFLNNKNPFMFILTVADSNGVYNVSDYYRVFKTWNGKWAEPVGTRRKKYTETRKALFKYSLLKTMNTKYFQLITDEIHCCKEQLIDFYSD